MDLATGPHCRGCHELVDDHAAFDGTNAESERDQQSFEPTLVTPETDNNGSGGGDGGQNNTHPV